MVPSHRPGAPRRVCSPSGIPFGLDRTSSTDDASRRLGMVAAGMNPAATATSVSSTEYEREPGWFPLIDRALRAGSALAPPPRRRSLALLGGRQVRVLGD